MDYVFPCQVMPHTIYYSHQNKNKKREKRREEKKREEKRREEKRREEKIHLRKDRDAGLRVESSVSETHHVTHAQVQLCVALRCAFDERTVAKHAYVYMCIVITHHLLLAHHCDDPCVRIARGFRSAQRLRASLRVRALRLAQHKALAARFGHVDLPFPKMERIATFSLECELAETKGDHMREMVL